MDLSEEVVVFRTGEEASAHRPEFDEQEFGCPLSRRHQRTAQELKATGIAPSPVKWARKAAATAG